MLPIRLESIFGIGSNHNLRTHVIPAQRRAGGFGHVPMGLVGSAGLEPARSFLQEILSLLCLPFHHEPKPGCSHNKSQNASPGRIVQLEMDYRRSPRNKNGLAKRRPVGYTIRSCSESALSKVFVPPIISPTGWPACPMMLWTPPKPPRWPAIIRTAFSMWTGPRSICHPARTPTPTRFMQRRWKISGPCRPTARSGASPRRACISTARPWEATSRPGSPRSVTLRITRSDHHQKARENPPGQRERPDPAGRRSFREHRPDFPDLPRPARDRRPDPNPSRRPILSFDSPHPTASSTKSGAWKAGVRCWKNSRARCPARMWPTATTAPPAPCASAANAAPPIRNHTGNEEYNWFLSVLFPGLRAEDPALQPRRQGPQRPPRGGLPRGNSRRFHGDGKCRTHARIAAETPHVFRRKWYGLDWPESNPAANPVGALDVSILQNRLLAPAAGHRRSAHQQPHRVHRRHPRAPENWYACVDQEGSPWPSRCIPPRSTSSWPSPTPARSCRPRAPGSSRSCAPACLSTRFKDWDPAVNRRALRTPLRLARRWSQWPGA